MTNILTPIQKTETATFFPKINYRTLGFRDAGITNGNVSAFDIALEKFYSRFINKIAREEKKIYDDNYFIEVKTQELKDKSELLQKELTKLKEEELPKYEKKKEEAVETYQSFKNDPTKFVKNEEDKFSLWLYGIVSLLVGIFLYFFYTSVIYSSLFMEIKANSLETISYYIFYPYTFEEAYKLGLSTLMLVIFAPFVFLAFGISIHSSRYKILVAGCVFIIDALLAYHISEKIYEAKAINIYSQVDKFNLVKAMYDINFWTIIALGYGVYFLFGYIFNKYKEHRNNSKKLQEKENELLEKIRSYDNLIIDINQKIERISNEIFESKSASLTLHKNPDKIIYNPSEIKRVLSDYSLGWIQYLSQGKYSDSDIDEIHSKFNSFLTKISSGEK